MASARKNLAGLGLAAILAVTGASCTSNAPASVPAQAAATPTSAINFNSMKAGAYLPQQYLDDLVARIPELKRLKDSGLFLGVVYDPSVSLMVKKANQEINDPNMSKAELEKLVNDYWSLGTVSGDKFLEAMIFPTINRNYASGMPFYIIMTRPALLESPISNDDEAISVLSHEAKHIEDFAKGVRFSNGISLSKGDEVTLAFFHALTEFRSYHLQMDLIFKAEVGITSAMYTDKFVLHHIVQYAQAEEVMRLWAQTPKEKSLLETQLAEARGILPSKLPDGSYRIDFNLYGQQKSITARK